MFRRAKLDRHELVTVLCDVSGPTKRAVLVVPHGKFELNVSPSEIESGNYDPLVILVPKLSSLDLEYIDPAVVTTVEPTHPLPGPHKAGAPSSDLLAWLVRGEALVGKEAMERVYSALGTEIYQALVFAEYRRVRADAADAADPTES